MCALDGKMELGKGKDVCLPTTICTSQQAESPIYRSYMEHFHFHASFLPSSFQKYKRPVHHQVFNLLICKTLFFPPPKLKNVFVNTKFRLQKASLGTWAYLWCYWVLQLQHLAPQYSQVYEWEYRSAQS